MDKLVTANSVIDAIIALTRAEVKEDEKGIDIRPHRFKKTIRVQYDKIEEIIINLNKKNYEDHTKLYDDNNYEIIVKEESQVHYHTFRDDNFSVEDKENQTTYEISNPTDEYLVFILSQMHDVFPKGPFGYGIYPLFRAERMMVEKADSFSIFDFLRTSIFRFLTIKIKSRNKTCNA
jgi:hypothetical protein